jgi:hypothetical protein
MYQKSLQIVVQCDGENSVLAGDIYNNLGRLENCLGNYAACQENLEKSLAIVRRTLGEDSDVYLDI